MKVPEDIRKVPRPRNTIVEDSGSDGIYRYSVRARGTVVCTPGKNPMPRNGKVIGHIINFEFVPINQQPAKLTEATPSSLSFGSSAFVYSVSEDLRKDLVAVFDASDAYRILAIASLRAIKPSIACNRYSTEYNRTFISIFYPRLALSKNSVCTFLQNLGKARSQRDLFIKKRIERICEFEHIAIDGTLKQDSSSVNSLSAFSYKGRVRGVKDISIIYAYSIERKEPLCAEVFPGNCLDASAFREFILHNNLQQGLIIADKGFPINQINQELLERPGLHYLSPLKRNDTRIRKLEMLEFDDAFIYGDQKVLCKKVAIDGNKFLVSFQDAYREYLEKTSYITRSAIKDGLDANDFKKKKDSFGVIVFETDQDLPAADIYRCYADRWELEVMFDMYKHDEDLTSSDVQNEFSIQGSEFIDLIATILTSRCVHRAEDAGILKEMTYRNLLTDLGQIWRKVDAPLKAKRKDVYWEHEFKEVLDNMVKLDLCEAEPELVVPRKTGRPKFTKQEDKPKRPVGRPRIHPKPDPNQPKRGRGRPRKHPKPDPNAPKRKVGRPRKNPEVLPPQGKSDA